MGGNFIGRRNESAQFLGPGELGLAVWGRGAATWGRGAAPELDLGGGARAVRGARPDFVGVGGAGSARRRSGSAWARRD